MANFVDLGREEFLVVALLDEHFLDEVKQLLPLLDILLGPQERLLQDVA